MILLITIGLFVVFAAAISMARNRTRTQKNRRYYTGRQVYVPGEFSGQMELDLRLPFRRFKQLYPDNKLSYKEYKQLQMQRAFRRSMASQDNKRMVR